jgi:hypothetical protein
MEVLVVQQKGSRLWRQYQREVGAPCHSACVPVHQEHEIVFRSGFVDPLVVQVCVPFVARALDGEKVRFVRGAFKHGSAVCIRGRGPADVGRKHVADTRQRAGGSYWVGGQDLSAWQPARVIHGIKPRRNAKLPQITYARRIVGLRFRTDERGQQQRGQDTDNRYHDKQLRQRKACGFFIHRSNRGNQGLEQGGGASVPASRLVPLLKITFGNHSICVNHRQTPGNAGGFVRPAAGELDSQTWHSD